MNPWTKPSLIEVPTFTDEFGKLGVIEKDSPYPFDIKRIYFLYEVPSTATRGSHAHKQLNQLIIALHGEFTVLLDNGHTVSEFKLTSANVGLTVPPGYWRTLSDFTPNSCGLVLASLEYDESDYIRDYDEFLAWANNE